MRLLNNKLNLTLSDGELVFTLNIEACLMLCALQEGYWRQKESFNLFEYEKLAVQQDKLLTFLSTLLYNTFNVKSKIVFLNSRKHRSILKAT